MRPYRIFFSLVLCAVLLWGGYRAWRAHQNLVTLNVRNMDVRKVVSKVQWQTWERIIVNGSVTGMVTLNVRAVPLEEVLEIIALQTNARWTALYPIYSQGSSVVAFKKLVRGDISPAGSGWTNLVSTPAWRGTLSTFASNLRARNNLVSAQFYGKDLAFATLALSRFAQAQVVAEDGATATINLTLREVPFATAVARVATQAKRKWDLLYTLQPLHDPNSPRVVRDAASAGTNFARVMDPRSPEERAAAREREFEARLVTMTPEERQKLMEQRQAVEELQSLPPEERAQRLQELRARYAPGAQPDFQQRVQNRLKNSTPDQRVERDRVRLERERRAQQERQGQ